MTPTLRAGKIRISREHLESALDLPKDHKIISAQWDMANRGMIVCVEGPLMPTVDPGYEIKEIFSNTYVHNDRSKNCGRRYTLTL